MFEEKSTPKIRPCESGDLERMREICVETSSLPLNDEKDRRFLLLMYCDSYFRLAAENCFVAVDETDRPVGYILCAADTRAFLREFKKRIIPEIKGLGLRYELRAREICAGQLLCAAFAPAHFHIDLTASARRKGVGTALMKTLKAQLSQKGIKSVQLTCGSGNKSAIAFYRKNGFKTLFRGFGACVMKAETEQ